MGKTTHVNIKISKPDNKSVTIENRKAYHNYFVEETLECGIVLHGNEVKSIRDGMASIKEAWISIENSEMFLKKMHITAWSTTNKFDIDENRDRKLLLHKAEIRKFAAKASEKGYTIIPLKIYFVGGKCKVQIGLCKGKHLYDKRQSEKDKQAKRDIERQTKGV